VSIPLGEALLALIIGCFVYILFIFCISDYIVVPLYLIGLSVFLPCISVYLICIFMYLVYML
jgi:hypothetical protein